MNKLFVRLAASGLMAVTLGAGAALADSNASISLSGPDSTNIISGGGLNENFRSNVRNDVRTNSLNMQRASTGNANSCGNTKVWDGGLGSGSAQNLNSGLNHTFISNRGTSMAPVKFTSSGSGNGSVFLTGPGSFNRVSANGNNRSSFSSSTDNNVNATNFNSQAARSGNVTITGNTLVTGAAGSGSASNFNQADNNLAISNQQPAFMAVGNWGPTGAAEITTTGPGSFNSIASGGNSMRVNLLTSNTVNSSNTNFQTASSGNVTISHNTVVSGVGGSGNATNWNSASNAVDISNN
jgi:hypothetical protein